MTISERINALESEIKSENKKLQRLMQVKNLSPGTLYIGDHIHGDKDIFVIVIDDNEGLDISKLNGRKIKIQRIDIAGEDGSKSDIADYENLRKLDTKVAIQALRALQ